jgi:hypothetical protein
MQTHDCWPGRPAGRVRQILNNDKEIFRGSNLVVDTSLEVMVNALMGRDRIARVEFADMSTPIYPGLRSLRNPVGNAAVGETTDLQPFVSPDSYGVRSIGTWSAVFTPSEAISYDTLGLITTNGRLFAATSFNRVDLNPGDSILVQWTILTRAD